MPEEKGMRLSQAAKQVNVSMQRIVELLTAKGYTVENNPNTKLSGEQIRHVLKEFEDSALQRNEANEISIGKKSDNIIINAGQTKKKVREDEDEIFIKNLAQEKQERERSEKEKAEQEKAKAAALKKEKEIEEKRKAEEAQKEAVTISKEEETVDNTSKVKLTGPKVLGKIDLESSKTKKGKDEKKTTPVKEEKKEEVKLVVEPEKEVVTVQVEEPVVKEPQEDTVIEAKAETLKGLTVLGKIELPAQSEKKKTESESEAERKKRKRVRIKTGLISKDSADFKDLSNANKFKKGKNFEKEAFSDKEIQDKIKDTLAKLSGSKNNPVSRSKYRKEKRSAVAEAEEERMLRENQEAKILKVTEFVSANDLASMMNVSVNEIISTCLGLGMFVSINQRLDAEAITLIADEFGYEVKFISTDEEEIEVEEAEDEDPADLEHRAPIVTIMGHVDHGKTSLLDYIRKSKIASREAGGITQHIGAYDVTTDSGKKITFLDTPGHEAFTAMRARGAKITDIVIIVVAADDSVMPQTREAINHAIVAGVPIIIAINKVDKPQANPDKIKEELAKENILVEDWGGKYQCELISAKSGKGIPELLEKILLEAEILDLKANPNKFASGTIVEASLDKGRGYLSTVLVQSGTLHIGDVILAGANYGRVKAMMDHLGQRLQSAGPSTPVQVLGLNGAPQSGDKLVAMEEEREAREIAVKREQLLREQSIRTKKHITLDEIGRRLAIGNFKELNIIVKGDVDGSVEALSDSLLKLSTDEIQIRIIHKGVGQISESDVLLASASDAVIVAFQVRPSLNARKLAEKEEIEIRMYSIIYDAINEVKDAMEGMLEPKKEEIITATVEVRQVFKISKIGTIAGSYVTDGVLKRNHQIRLIRDGIVMHTGRIDALKRLKDDASEVKTGFECGISIQGYNDILEGDIIEGFEEREVKRKL